MNFMAKKSPERSRRKERKDKPVIRVTVTFEPLPEEEKRRVSVYATGDCGRRQTARILVPGTKTTSRGGGN